MSRQLCTAQHWLRVVTRSRCSLVVRTAPTQVAIVTCWSGWVLWVRWSASFLPVRCRRDIGSWPAPDCWGALSGSTVVVEAGARSGALRVAAEARQLGRQVGAVPGPVTSVTSHGPHELLRTGHARLVTSVADVEQLTADRATHRPGLSAEFARREGPATGPPERSL